jgi:Domain of unknown function (DUF1883)
MEHEHYDLGQLPQGATVEVAIDTRLNVLLMDDVNYRTYCGGGTFEYIGGEALRSPLRFGVPSPGHWHVAIDAGGGQAQFRAGVEVYT